MKDSVYLETTVVSYYTSKPNRDIIVLAHQEITRQWWPMAIRRFNVLISEVVIEEAGLGDQEAAKRRLEELKHFPHLELDYESGGVTMWQDPIVEEVRKAGEELAKQANYDLHTFFENLRNNEKRQNQKIVSLKEDGRLKAEG